MFASVIRLYSALKGNPEVLIPCIMFLVEPKKDAIYSLRGEIVIPEFKNIHEIARFWETHSLADFEDELEDADDVEFVRPGTRVVSLRLQETDYEKLNRLARKKGINKASLLRAWVKENLKREEV